MRAQEALRAMDPAVVGPLDLLSAPDAALGDLILSEAALGLGDEVRWGARALGRWGAGAAADAHTI